MSPAPFCRGLFFCSRLKLQSYTKQSTLCLIMIMWLLLPISSPKSILGWSLQRCRKSRIIMIQSDRRFKTSWIKSEHWLPNFKRAKGSWSVRHRNADDIVEGMLGGGINTTNKRQKSSGQSSISISTTTHGCAFSTPASSTVAPTESVSFADTTAARADGGRNGIDENKDEYADCTYDIRE